MINNPVYFRLPISLKKGKNKQNRINMKIIESCDKFQKKRIVDVTDEISMLIRRIELNYGLSLEEALISINLTIKNMNSKVQDMKSD